MRLKEETALSLRDKVGWVCYTWVYQSVGVCACAQYEEVSLALPDESPDGKHNYLPHCLPIISAGEVQVSQLKP